VWVKFEGAWGVCKGEFAGAGGNLQGVGGGFEVGGFPPQKKVQHRNSPFGP